MLAKSRDLVKRIDIGLKSEILYKSRYVLLTSRFRAGRRRVFGRDTKQVPDDRYEPLLSTVYIRADFFFPGLLAADDTQFLPGDLSSLTVCESRVKSFSSASAFLFKDAKAAR